MKFDCGPTWQEKFDAKKRWHLWFAWHPVRLASHDCIWLEYVERKGTNYYDSGGGYWDWQYRNRAE
jgi:hypothetical protein